METAEGCAPAVSFNLDRLLRPRSIAVIGGREAAEVIRQCRRLGFEGAVYPVHPYKSEQAGVVCYRSIAELPEAPDAAFVAVNRDLAITAVIALAARGCGGAVCYAAGFKESSDSGGRQQQLLDAAAAMPLIGPNCYGLINYLDKVALWPDQHGGHHNDYQLHHGVALITQSGNIALNLTMQRRALPLAYVITLGNQAQLGLPEVIDALLSDDRVSAIGLHIESIGDAPAFARAAARARASHVPIVAIKTGRSPAGERLALSHTASLAGNDRLTDVFLQRLGIARVTSLTVLLETLKILHVGGALSGNRISSMSCSGGEAALIADAAAGRGLCFPELEEEHAQHIGSTLSDLVHITNPLDYHTFIWADEVRLYATYRAMLQGGFDLNLLLLDFPRPDFCDGSSWQPSIDALCRASRDSGARCAVLATLPENLPEPVARQLLDQGIVALQGIDDALSAIDAAIVRGAGQLPFCPPASVVAAAGISSGHDVLLDEWSAKQRLAAYGIAIPEACRAGAGEVSAAADRIGYPLVLKALVPGLAHKTEQGAVALDLRSPAAVAAALERMQALSDRFIVERMIDDGVAELIVGIGRDPQFGPYLLLGSGGVLAELIGDSRLLLPPVTRDDIEQALQQLRVWPPLTGYRGRLPGDIDALLDTIENIARFAADHADRLLELDINPLIVRPAGRGVVAADALIRICEQSVL